MFACLWVRVSCAACLWRTPEWQTGRVFTRLEVQGGCYLMYRCRCWLLFVFVFVRLCIVWCVSETRCDIYLNPSGCFMTSAEGFLTISATSPPSLAELYVLFLASLRLLKSFLVDWVEDLLMLQVDFEATVQENRFTVKPNVDPAIDESKGSLHCFFRTSVWPCWAEPFLFSCQRRGGWRDCLTSWQTLPEENLNIWILEFHRAVSFTSLWSDHYLFLMHWSHNSQSESFRIRVYLSLQIGFLLSLPRLPSMVEKEDFEMEGLDFMVC